MKKTFIIFILFLISFSFVYAKDYTQDDYPQDKKYNPFRIYNADKYYTGWQNPRSFIGKLFFHKNFDLEKTFLPPPNANFDLKSIAIAVDGRVASEIIFYRNKYFTVGVGAAMEVLMFGRKSGKFDVYDFSGQFSPYVDIYLKEFTKGLANVKIRLEPIYHQSTHFVDGYGDSTTFRRGSSYEFAAVSGFWKIKTLNVYGGFEGTYNAIGNGAQLIRVHLGSDYRYPIIENINFICGLNIAAINDKQDEYNLIDNRWHFALNAGAGIEFYRFVFALKLSFQRDRGATTYYTTQTKLGAELSLFF